MAVGVDAVERALAIVDAFRSGARTMSLKELADRTGLNKATILRLIVSLERFQYVTRMGEGRYALGPALAHLGSVYQRSFRLSDHVLPILQRLVDQTSETAAFFVRDKTQRVCLFMVESTNTLRSHLREGDVRPLRPGGTGIILQAFSGEAGEELDRARNDYLALNIGERHSEIASIAAPAFKADQQLVGAISVSGPIGHFAPSTVPPLSAYILKAAADLTQQLGGNAEPLLVRYAKTTASLGDQHKLPHRPDAAVAGD